jgi:transcriptional regulator with XRE-family HTH domain
METVNYTNMLHMGRKIERIRRLRGMTQTELGEALGITKQAVSKMEQTEKFEIEKLKTIASALGVTEDGLKSFNEEKVLYNTMNFYDNSSVSASSINANNVETLNNFPIEKTIELFEKLLQKEREKYEEVKKTKK